MTYTYVPEGVVDNVDYVTVLDEGGNPIVYSVTRAEAERDYPLDPTDDEDDDEEVFAPAPDLTLKLDEDERDSDGEGICIEQGRDLMDSLELDRSMRYTIDREDIEHDNLRRARHAWNALTTYTDDVYGHPGSEPTRQAVSDLLGDLLHLCDALDVDFDTALDKGRSNYEPETHGEL